MDDCSDYTLPQKNYIRKKLTGHIVRFNAKRDYAVHNAHTMIHQYARDAEGVIVSLDGDDWLLHRDALSNLADVYRKTGCLLSYGECLVWDGKSYSELPARRLRPYTNIPYPASVIRNKSYRTEPFYPLHPRSWKVRLYKQIPRTEFLRPDGTWLHFCEDLAIFFPILEQAGSQCTVLTQPLSVYNMATRHGDLPLHTTELLRDELYIRRKHINETT